MEEACSPGAGLGGIVIGMAPIIAPVVSAYGPIVLGPTGTGTAAGLAVRDILDPTPSPTVGSCIGKCLDKTDLDEKVLDEIFFDD